MQVNTRTAMLRGLELRKKLGSWEAVEKLGQPLDEMIDLLRPPVEGDTRAEIGVRSGE